MRGTGNFLCDDNGQTNRAHRRRGRERAAGASGGPDLPALGSHFAGLPGGVDADAVSLLRERRLRRSHHPRRFHGRAVAWGLGRRAVGRPHWTAALGLRPVRGGDRRLRRLFPPPAEWIRGSLSGRLSNALRDLSRPLSRLPPRRCHHPSVGSHPAHGGDASPHRPRLRQPLRGVWRSGRAVLFGEHPGRALRYAGRRLRPPALARGHANGDDSPGDQRRHRPRGDRALRPPGKRKGRPGRRG